MHELFGIGQNLPIKINAKPSFNVISKLFLGLFGMLSGLDDLI